ncbi:MAG: TIGR02996 domain-containing protein [Planctomycetes bacterium]|nr:TIGR02996 domain-containing protein [Planctomycetota bacterium]
MPPQPTNAALEKAIVAHPDEDTPRLAYADWLDEHGDPDRAAFIRAQCRLADLSPAAPDWIDLREQELELAARLRGRDLAGIGRAPGQFSFDNDLTSAHEESFRRGFPFFIDHLTSGDGWTDREIARVVRELTRYVQTTTIRAVSFNELPLDAARKLLAEPVLAELTGFTCFPHIAGHFRAGYAEFFRFLCAAPALRRVTHLFLYGAFDPLPAGELARATVFDAVRRLTIQNIEGTKADLDRLVRAKWFRRVQHFRCFIDRDADARALAPGLGDLPDLHTLDLAAYPAGGVAALAKAKFPALARLMYSGPITAQYAKALAKGKFPALVAFEVHRSGAKNDGLAELLKADWFGQLRALDMRESGIGDKGVKALAAHDAARTLRALRLGDNPFGPGGLAALGQFPALTALDMHSYLARKPTSAQLAAWLAGLALSNLRHLNLTGWPLGDAGAKALAANPALAGLTRLELDSCQIGDAGARALFESPHLQNLVELDLSDNRVKAAADALADAGVMPRLGICNLSGNKVAPKSKARIARPGLYLRT